MNSIFIRKKEELFLKVHEQIEQAKLIVSQSRKRVEQAKQQGERIKNQTGTYFPSPKDTTSENSH